ncbi:MAG: YicC family protein [Rhodospirillaceae bacterium]|mgnify:CR=1 FL=1|nr:YicC family protein [Rhodospirillaceae bacterium]
MSISSMTGFARAEGRKDSRSWTWEVKSVNAKGLDVRCRVPAGFERLEHPARERVKGRFRRGNVTLALSVSSSKGEAGYRVNHVVLGEMLVTLPEIIKQVPDAGPPSVDGLLALKGVIEPVEDDITDDAREALDAEILADLDSALESLAAMRGDEGSKLALVLNERLDDIGRLCGEAEKLAETQPQAIHEKLKAQVQTLLDDMTALPDERLAQETALLASKADLREELDRLKAHLEAARGLMTADGGVGRKLDFLCQEFNRETNTLCSKSQNVGLTRIGLDLKATIEQFREQVQNIE